MKVAILGASAKPERYAHQAKLLLTENEHKVFPVSPLGAEILGVKGFASIGKIEEFIDIVTLYLGPARLEPLIDEIIAAKPKRVIFNPGIESEIAKRAFEKGGIETEEACTLVLLRTGGF